MYNKKDIEVRIMNDQKWLERGIVAIYKKQTRDEQNCEHTKYNNMMGFNSPDAHRLTYYAKWILSGKHLNGIHLERARKQMKKYSGQLTRIANGEV